MNWETLRNPILSYEDYSIKDACLIWRDGLWHLFFSAFDQARSTVVQVTTRDFMTYSPFRFQLDGRADGWIGMCSPDVACGDGRYVVVFNSWGSMKGRPNALFYIESPDLASWSEPKPLGHELAPDARIIDGALAWNGSRWICICKWWKQPRVAAAPHLAGPWHWIGDEPADLLDETGRENGMIHENFQLLQIDGQWHLLSTDYSKGKGVGTSHTPWCYRMDGDPATPAGWLRWTDGRALDVPGESFNTIDVINAAGLCDHRAQDGHFYLLYGGKNEVRSSEFVGTAAHAGRWPRGWNRLGLARSRDLQTWELPGGSRR